jgi:integrase
LSNDHKVGTNTMLFNRAALRFVYVNTLKQKWFDDEIARPKRRPTLPPTLSAEEVTRILNHTYNLKHWTIIATFYATALRLGGHPKSGHTWSLQNRPTETLRNTSFLAEPWACRQQISAADIDELA